MDHVGDVGFLEDVYYVVVRVVKILHVVSTYGYDYHCQIVAECGELDMFKCVAYRGV